jgi:hypothetical protein
MARIQSPTWTDLTRIQAALQGHWRQSLHCRSWQQRGKQCTKNHSAPADGLTAAPRGRNPVCKHSGRVVARQLGNVAHSRCSWARHW